ncbi:3-oxoacyl-ACP reductase FabG [Bacillus luteolus]|uniref:3-oxoacyl-[acyl-carrier-protein] reductase n=1 Tax=Litchfieldia luteola TaxID=682179 RepID=A0ABR9QL96_9BACI|nr:3-oxoacyl-ACP reductase FabG [Cytobacillus luteolus]MBE4909270.1 3-oxoacyl-ACP reductase FabG [Cytobacillus luteolus]MBP1940664.1 3-oxoacyl-[acyl-carrier protein] reductase [Cytobacillus luteolus]
MRLQDKVAIITGAANGLGYEAAVTFTREGAKVALVDFDQSGEQRAQELKDQGADVEFFQVDVANRESVDNMVSQVLDRFGKIDILINNAGITRDGMLTKLSQEDFQKVLDVNLTGVFNCTQAVVPHMISQSYGKIVSTSSVSGVYGNVGQTNYAATKAAVVGMTKTWAKELGRKGINVNAVAPGFIETNMVAAVPEKVIEQMKSIIPLQRLGKPSDIANAYLYLASDEATYVNGTTLHVDGGIMM